MKSMSVSFAIFAFWAFSVVSLTATAHSSSARSLLARDLIARSFNTKLAAQLHSAQSVQAINNGQLSSDNSGIVARSSAANDSQTPVKFRSSRRTILSH